MKLRELYEAWQTDTNPDHNWFHTQINNAIINPLRDLISAFDESEAIRLLGLLKIQIEKAPYGGMDADEEKQIRDKITQAVNKLLQDLNPTTFREFVIGPMGDFWVVMTP